MMGKSVPSIDIKQSLPHRERQACSQKQSAVRQRRAGGGGESTMIAGTRGNTKILTTSSANSAMRSMKIHTHFRSVFGSIAPPPAADGGASCGLARAYLQKIECPKQVLWTALVGQKAALLHSVPHMEDNTDACFEELTEAVVLHCCCPNGPGRSVLDVPGFVKKILSRSTSSSLSSLTSASLSVNVSLSLLPE